MDSPKHLSPCLRSEFEEEDTVQDKNVAEKSENINDDMKSLKSFLAELKQWGNAIFDKKKLARVDFDEFNTICNKLAVAVNKAETRCSTQSAIGSDISSRFEKLERNVAQLIEATQNKKPSFAEAVRLPGRRAEDKTHKKPQEEQMTKKIVPKQKVVVIRPKQVSGNEKEASEKVKESLKKCIAKDQSVNVKKAVNVRGGGVLLVLDPAGDKDKILGNKVLNNPNWKVSEPQILKPRIIIYDVPAILTPDELAEDVFNRNVTQTEGLENFKNQFKPSFKLGPRDREVVHWVVECSPDVRKELINKYRLFVDWHSCRVKDYVSVARCFKCQSLGHVGKYCKHENVTCAHCAGVGHDMKNCPNKSKDPTCANCLRSKRDATHKVSDSICPTYQKALQQQIGKTDYGV
jgi:hypothetical protein